MVFSGSIKKPSTQMPSRQPHKMPTSLQSMDELIDDDFDRRFGCHS